MTPDFLSVTWSAFGHFSERHISQGGARSVCPWILSISPACGRWSALANTILTGPAGMPIVIAVLIETS